jgi:hypothetical protein
MRFVWRSGREPLFRRYGAGLTFGADALDIAADRAAGTTGSFAKELVRRAVLLAAEREHPVTDAELAESLDELLASTAKLSRNLLGGGQEQPTGDIR